MFRFMLGVLVGATAMAAWLGQTGTVRRTRPAGHVDELSTAAGNVVADPPLNAGDGTPSRTAATGV